MNVLITGANRGIGLELVRGYLSADCNVIACCRHPQKAEALHALSNDYPGLSIHALDVTSDCMINNLSSALSDYKIDILIHNAGIYGSKSERGEGMEEFYGPALGDIDTGEWLNVFEVNAIAPLKVTSSLLPLMKHSEVKKIIFISTMMGSIGSKDYGGCYAYSSSKAALNMAGKTLSNDLSDQGFIVGMVHPGWVSTDMGGPNAPVTPAESVAGIKQTIDDLQDTGTFFDFDGSPRCW